MEYVSIIGYWSRGETSYPTTLPRITQYIVDDLILHVFKQVATYLPVYVKLIPVSTTSTI